MEAMGPTVENSLTRSDSVTCGSKSPTYKEAHCEFTNPGGGCECGSGSGCGGRDTVLAAIFLGAKSQELRNRGEFFFFFFFKREKVLERVVFVTTVTCVCSGTICSRSRAFFFLVFVVSVSEREREGMRDLYTGLYGQ